MDKDEIVVVDKNLRFHDDKMEQELKKAADEKLKRAEAEENARFERPTSLDKFLDAILRLKKKKAKEEESEKIIAQKKQNSR